MLDSINLNHTVDRTMVRSVTRKMENGEELKSGVFSSRAKDRQTDWFMRINPYGEEKTKRFVSPAGVKLMHV